MYNTHKSQADGVLLEVPHFGTSAYKSTENYGLSFAYDAPTIWNDKLDDVCLATSIHLFRKKLKTYLFAKAIPTLISAFSQSFSMVLTPAMSLVNDYEFLLFLYYAPRVGL